CCIMAWIPTSSSSNACRPGRRRAAASAHGVRCRMQRRDGSATGLTIDARRLLGSHDLLFITFDALRYDVAIEALQTGLTPHLRDLLPGGTWERRHTPGSFTYAAHQAFFAGFLPTPVEPDGHERLFALRFAGSRTTGPRTCLFDAPDIVSGF